MTVSGKIIWKGSASENVSTLWVESQAAAGLFTIHWVRPATITTAVSSPDGMGTYTTVYSDHPGVIVEYTVPAGRDAAWFYASTPRVRDPVTTANDATGLVSASYTLMGPALGDVEIAFTGTFQLREWYNPAHASRQNRVYESAAGAWEFTVTASGNIGQIVQGAWNGSSFDYTTYEGALSGSHTESGTIASNSNSVFSSYGATLGLQADDPISGVSVEISYSGEGSALVDYSDTQRNTARGGDIAGTLATAGGLMRLTMNCAVIAAGAGGSGVNGGALVSATQHLPWQWQFDIQGAHYAGGEGLTPTLYLYNGGGNVHGSTGAIIATGGSPLHYPGSANQPNFIASLSVGFGGGFDDDTTSTTGLAWSSVHALTNLYCRVDEAWGDGNGILLASGVKQGNNKFCLFNYGPEFVAARLKIDSSHRFSTLIDPAVWTADWGSPAVLEGNALRFTRTLGGFFDAGAATWTLSTTRRFRPFAYRYYRLRIKCDRANTRVELRLSVSGFQTIHYLTVSEANVWETVEIDLSNPDVRPLGDENLWPVHPGNFGTNGAGLVLATPANTAINFWLEYIEGYHKIAAPGEIRTPLRLPRNLMVNQLYTPLHNTLDAPKDDALLALDQAIDDTDLTFPGGGLWGRLIVNGRWGFDFNGASNTVSSVWTSFRNLLNSATRDTGIHIELGSGADFTNWATETQHFWGYPAGDGAPGDGSFAADAWADIKARCKLMQPFGYPGYGDGLTYGAVMPMRDTKVWRGEVLGSIPDNYRSRARIALVTQDGLAKLAEVRSDNDGFFRIPGESGVVRTYSNLPLPAPRGTATASDRQHFTDLGGGNYSYDAIGQGFAFHYLRSSRFEDKDADHILMDAYEGARRKVVILDHYPSWYDLRLVPGGEGVCNLTTDWGFYFQADADDLQIRVRRSRLWPAFDLDTYASPPDDEASFPHLYRDARERLWCLWQDGSRSYRAYSDDDGETWSDPEMGLPGTYPCGDCDPATGTVLEAAYNAGSIVARLQYPGDPEPGEPFTVQGLGDLADTDFDVVWDRSGQRRVIYLVHDGTTTRRYESFDDGRTVSLVADT